MNEYLSQSEELILQSRFLDALALLDRREQEESGSLSAQVVALKIAALNGLGRWREAIELGLTNLEDASADESREALGKIHGLLGTACLRIGNLKDAEVHLRAAIHILTWDLHAPDKALREQRRLAVVFSALGLWQSARYELYKAIGVADRLGVGRESCGLRTNLAVVLLKSGDLQAVPRVLEEALAIHLPTEQVKAHLLVHLLRARYLVLTHHPTQALEILTPILATTREQRYSREEAICLEYMGDCHLLQKEFRRALEHYNAALKIAEATAPKGDLIPELGHRIGEALVNLGDPNAAILSCERGLRVARDTGDRYEVRDSSRARHGELVGWQSQKGHAPGNGGDRVGPLVRNPLRACACDPVAG